MFGPIKTFSRGATGCPHSVRSVSHSGLGGGRQWDWVAWQVTFPSPVRGSLRREKDATWSKPIGSQAILIVLQVQTGCGILGPEPKLMVLAYPTSDLDQS